MSYFDEVYLKRINRDGQNQQERVKTREEKEFDRLVLQKTKYAANIVMINDDPAQVRVSLQPDKNNETKVLFKLMMSNSVAKLKTGDILYIYQEVNGDVKESTWLVLHDENDITKGYQVYRVLLLDQILNITDEHGTTVYSIPVAFVNTSQNWVIDTFQFSKTSYGYREPAGNSSFITKDFDFLQKDIYFNYKDRGFQIMGKDNISVDGVAYNTFGERSLRPIEPTASDELPVNPEENENFFLTNLGDRYGVK